MSNTINSASTYNQASLKVFCGCKRRSEKYVPAGNMDCNRSSYTDLDEKCLQKFEVCHFAPASGVHRSRRLMSSAYNREHEASLSI